eukprot:NODE_13378_length_1169_cov_4.471209.p1 GENE.NODE_13378_length_1169_cov_4.471209~~NODE_13378_length_1169_cov_4.471209.p1  ORF type:complete len:332 (+),score=93.81 NODE_13378_length_1169_cov_4.471209:45-998(+)
MPMRAAQLLPQEGNGGRSGRSAYGPLVGAHAHLAQAEIHADGRAAGLGIDRAQQQRALWHLDRARAPLHGGEEPGAAARLLLAHVYMLHAKVLAEGCSAAGGAIASRTAAPSRRQAEQSLDMLVMGCRCATAGEDAATRQSPLRRAWDEAHELLLKRLRALLHHLCSREGAASRGGGGGGGGHWKAAYRLVLQLSPSAVASVPELFSDMGIGGIAPASAAVLTAVSSATGGTAVPAVPGDVPAVIALSSVHDASPPVTVGTAAATAMPGAVPTSACGTGASTSFAAAPATTAAAALPLLAPASAPTVLAPAHPTTTL